MRVPAGSATAALALTLMAAPGVARADGPGRLALGIGAYDVRHGNSEGQFRLEYRFAPSVLRIIQPLVGAFSTTGRTFFGYAGIRIELPLGEHVVLMADTAAGYWRHGRGLDSATRSNSSPASSSPIASPASRASAPPSTTSPMPASPSSIPGVESLLLVYSYPLGGI
jgi:hypothetical protein